MYKKKNKQLVHFWQEKGPKCSQLLKTLACLERREAVSERMTFLQAYIQFCVDYLK